MICLSIVRFVSFQRLSSLLTFLLAAWISSLSHGLSGRTVKHLLTIGACESRTHARPLLYCNRALSQSPAGDVRSGSLSRSEQKEEKSIDFSFLNSTFLTGRNGRCALAHQWIARWSLMKSDVEQSTKKLSDDLDNTRSRVWPPM